jgi:putative endonuclease
LEVVKQLKGWTRKKKEALINGDFKLLREYAKCKNGTSFEITKELKYEK